MCANRRSRVDAFDHRLLTRAARLGNKEILSSLLKEDRMPIRPYDILCAAIQTDNVIISSFLLQQDKIRCSEPAIERAFKYAIMHKKMAVLQYCVHVFSGSYFCQEARENMFTQICIQGWDGLVAVMLRDWNVDPTCKRMCGLMAAISRGHTHVVRALLNDRRFEKALRELPDRLFVYEFDLQIDD